MKKKLLALTFPFLLLLCACGAQPNAAPPDVTDLSVVATTYPIYLFTSEVTKGVKGISVSPLINQDVSCLHNYTLTVNDMKTIEGADVLLLTGAALDDFVLAASHSNSDLKVIDCSKALVFLPGREASGNSDASKHDHDHGNIDPHFWLDPLRAAAVIEEITKDLSDLDPANEEVYRANAAAATETLNSEYARLYDKLAPLTCRKLITFHDGFTYFANAFDLELLMSVEEEQGQEASGQVIAHALDLIKTEGLPAIFTEENSSDATAQAIARESGVSLRTLSLIMSGTTENPGIDRYIAELEQNVDTLLEALQ